MSRPGFKRVEPFSPTQVAGCALWLDANDASTVTGTTNVTNVRDKSANGVNLSNATGYSYPNNAFNGTYPSFYCPNGFASSSSATLGYNTAFALTMPFSLFFVGVQTNTGTYGDLCDAAPGGANRIYTYTQQLKVQTPFGETSPGYTGTNFILWVSYVAGTNASSVWINGNSIINGTIGQFTCSGITVANRFSLSESFPGHICEVLAFNSGLSSTQQQQVEGYLAQKWGLRSNLPSSHLGQTGIIYPTVRRNGTLNTASSTLPYYTQFSPLSISGCALWLDASDATSYTNTSGVITLWKDKVATITTSAAKGSGPSLSNINGLNALYFNAGSNIMSVNVTQSRTNRTFFMIVNSISNGGGYIWPSSANGFGVEGRDPTALTLADQNVAYIRFSPSFPSLGRAFIATIAYAGATNTQFYINGSGPGTDGGQTSSSTLSSDNTHYIGGNLVGYAATFILGEIIEFNVTLTTTQIQTIESYLAQKWGVTLAVGQSIPTGTLPLVTNLIGVPRRNMIPKPIVIATGGTIVTANGYRTHTFTTVGSSNFVLTSTVPGLSFQVLVVSGGGAGGGNVGGGGGAGGAQLLTPTLSTGSYTVTVGNGGAIDSGTGQGQSGGSSTFNATTIVGGGAGGVYGANAGLAGACGGGAGNNYTFGTGSVGSNGGSTSGICGGGGGGMGGAGTSGSGYNGGTGGAGLSYTIGGVSYTVCGGGGGAGYDVAGTAGVGGSGGSGVGAAGATVNNQPGGALTPTANRGGGGGGGTNNGNDAASPGAAGIVIVSYVYP